MTSLNSRFRALIRNHCGTTIIEFAVVAPLFFLVFLGALEFGLITYTQVALETAVDEAGRDVSISTTKGTGYDRVGAFTTEMQQKTAALINGKEVAVTAQILNDGGSGGTADPKKQDICLIPGQPPSTPPTGGCVDPNTGNPAPFINNDGAAVYQGPGSINVGNAGQEVQLEVTLPWKVQFPFVQSLFVAQDNNGNRVEGVIMLSATTVIRNEPQ